MRNKQWKRLISQRAIFRVGSDRKQRFPHPLSPDVAAYLASDTQVSVCSGFMFRARNRHIGVLWAAILWAGVFGISYAQTSSDIANLQAILSAYPILSSSNYGWSTSSFSTACVNQLFGVTCNSLNTTVTQLYDLPLGPIWTLTPDLD